MDPILNILIPLAGKGTAFAKANYTFPKPLIDVHGKSMIELVIHNLRPSCPHRFVFVCQKDLFEKYDLYHVFQNATDNHFEVVLMNGTTQGAACTALMAINHINSSQDLIIANADQYIDNGIQDFIDHARAAKPDGLIMTFQSSHPRWSYTRVDENGHVLEVAEKKVISNKATSGLYYFKEGKSFINGAQAMIQKDIRTNNEFYICPVHNELILDGKIVSTFDVSASRMHGLGTPEDLNAFLQNHKREGGL